MRYSDRKAAQVAAAFIAQAATPLEVLKLIKLMYLADRESYRRHGFPITHDATYSLPHGPVLSHTLNHMNGEAPSSDDGWSAWISKRNGNDLTLAGERSIDRAALDELSDADIEAVEATWQAYGRFTASQLRRITHRECTEYVDPDGSRLPISAREILDAVGWDKDASARVIRAKREHEAIDRMLR